RAGGSRGRRRRSSRRSGTGRFEDAFLVELTVAMPANPLGPASGPEKMTAKPWARPPARENRPPLLAGRSAHPALVAELDGQIRVLVAGKVDTTRQHGIRNTFETVPDAPLEKFVLERKGGKSYGLLENSEDLCAKKQVASAVFTAQNGKVLELSPTIADSCGKGGKGKKGKKQGGGKKR